MEKTLEQSMSFYSFYIRSNNFDMCWFLFDRLCSRFLRAGAWPRERTCVTEKKLSKNRKKKKINSYEKMTVEKKHNYFK